MLKWYILPAQASHYIAFHLSEEHPQAHFLWLSPIRYESLHLSDLTEGLISCSDCDRSEGYSLPSNSIHKACAA